MRLEKDLYSEGEGRVWRMMEAWGVRQIGYICSVGGSSVMTRALAEEMEKASSVTRAHQGCTRCHLEHQTRALCLQV